MSKPPPLRYVVLSERDGQHHVMIERPGSPWLQRIAQFHLLDRAEQYADIENDMYADGFGGSPDQNDKPPTTPEPPSAIPALVERVRTSEHLEDVARLEGREEGRAEVRARVAEAAAEMRAEVDEPVIAPAPPAPPVAAAAPQPKPKIEPVRQPAPVPKVAPSIAKAGDRSARAVAVEKIQKTIVADLDAMMKEFPRGPTTRDLQKKYSEPADWLGEALRDAHDKGLLRYELDPSRPGGRYDSNKYVRPVGYQIPAIKAAAVPQAAPRPTLPVQSPPPVGPLTDRILTRIVGEFDRLGPFTLTEIAKLFAEGLPEVRVACEELDATGRAQFITIDRTAGRQLVPIGWTPPTTKSTQNITEIIPMLVSAPSNEGEKSDIEPEDDGEAEPEVDLEVNDEAVARARAEQMREFEAAERRAAARQELTVPAVPAVPAVPNLPAVRISPTAAALADFQRSKLAKSAQRPLARVVDHTPAHVGIKDCGEPAYERSALFERQVEQRRQAAARRDDEPVSLEDLVRRQKHGAAPT